MAYHFLLILLSGFLLGASWKEAAAEDWVLFAVSMDGKIEEYYDRSTVSFPSPGVVKLTTKTVKYAPAEEGRGQRGRPGTRFDREGLQLCAYSLTRHQIECRNRIDTMLNTADYDRDGRLVQHSDEPCVVPRNPYRRPPQELYPESVSENLIKIVCPPIP